MSTSILPSLAGLGFDVTRTPVWDTTVQTSISGKETRVALMNSPRWKWELTYNVLRSSASYGELQLLAGFFNARQGQFDTFLYQDADDNAVTGQQLGTGNGSTTQFQLVRGFGGFIEPVLAPNAVSHVYLNGTPTAVTVSNWGTGSPGVITFSSAPGSGAVITADFTYYFPCRMSEDSVEFTLFLSQHYKVKKFGFISVRN